MEQFLVVPASVYNKNFKIQSLNKQDLSKHQGLENLAYQIDSLKEEINKGTFPKADFLVDKVLFLSTYQDPNFADFIFGWCRN